MTPQYHVVFDEDFHTVTPAATTDDVSNGITDLLDNLVDNAHWVHTDDFSDDTTRIYFDFNDDLATMSQAIASIRASPSSTPTKLTDIAGKQSVEWPTTEPVAKKLHPLTTDSESPDLSLAALHAALDDPDPLASSLYALFNELPPSPTPDHLSEMNKTYDGLPYEGEFDLSNPVAFAAGAKNNPNILSQSQMLRAEDSDAFVATQIPEIRGLEDMQVFEYHPASDMPHGRPLLNAIWSYRRKRRVDGTLLKHKSHICADGSQMQHGIDYWESYAPVVHWLTVCLTMVLAALLGLKNRQVDFTQAFVQADLADDVLLRVPQGWCYNSTAGLLEQHTNPAFTNSSHKKNLYGVVQASRNWFLVLRQALVD